MVQGIGGSGNNQPIFGFNPAGKTDKTNTSSIQTTKPIELKTNTEKIDRQDLDNLSPYAGLVKLTQKPPVGTVESYQAAEPVFGKLWSGNLTFSPSGKQEAVEYLTAYADAVKNYGEVAQHLQNSPYAEVFG